MSVLKLQTMTPRTTSAQAAAISVTSSSSQCCNAQKPSGTAGR